MGRSILHDIQTNILTGRNTELTWPSEIADHGGGGRDALLSPIPKGFCQKVQLPWSMGMPSFLFLDFEPFFGISTRRAGLKR